MSALALARVRMRVRMRVRLRVHVRLRLRVRVRVRVHLRVHARVRVRVSVRVRVHLRVHVPVLVRVRVRVQTMAHTQLVNLAVCQRTHRSLLLFPGKPTRARPARHEAKPIQPPSADRPCLPTPAAATPRAAPAGFRLQVWDKPDRARKEGSEGGLGNM